MTKFNFDKPVNSPMDTDTYPEGAYANAEEIEDLFESIEVDSEFIDSIWTWWDEKGFLTKKQFYKLKQIAEGD